MVLLLESVFEMHLGVALPFVAARELSAASVAAEGLFARMSPYVRGEVVGPREGAHADTALEGFLSRVDADVAGELV